MIGLHGRNAVDWPELDFELLSVAGIQYVKMMSDANLAVFERIKHLNIVTRLYDRHLQDTYFNQHKRPSPQEFADTYISKMQQIKDISGSVMFEVHNEPNHPNKYEGWGVSDEDALDFDNWFLQVSDSIKSRLPWAQLGFPGLAVPHRDLNWIDICWSSISRADWLGCHCYWQYENHLSDEWGLRFKHYHSRYPDKDIHITECGNSNAQSGIELTEQQMARQAVEYFQECFKYPYLKSVSFFLASSQDPVWSSFTWRTEDGRFKEIVKAVSQIKNSAG